MKIARFVFAAAALAGAAVPTVRAQAPPAPPGTVASDSDIAAVLRLEREMWDAWQRHDFAAVKSRTAPDYVCATETEYYPWSVIEKGFDDYRLQSYSLGKMEVLKASPDVIVLTYSADIRGAVGGKDVSRKAAESAIWARRGGRWLAVYLHEITAAPAAGAAR
ncbi:MAG TPA: nuclear transport factor 2 family protein [Thermoanaerobaculia bacterium]